MKYIFFFLVLLFVPFIAPGQDHFKKEQLIEKFYTKGIALRSSQKDSSYYYFDQAYRYSIELKQYSDGMEVLISGILTSSFHYDLNAYEKYLKKFEDLLLQEKVRNDVDNLTYYENRFVFEKAGYFYDRKDYENAGLYFRKYYSAYSKIDPKTLSPNVYGMFVHTLNYLGLIYTNTEKYELAEDYFNRSLSFVETNKTEQSDGLKRATLHLLSKLYTLTKRYEEADLHLINVLKAYKRLYADDKEYKNNIIAAYEKLVQNAMEQQEFQKALTYLEESGIYLLPEDPFSKRSLLLYGDIYSNQDKNQKALISYQVALEAFQKFRQNEPHQDIAEVQGKIAELYLKQKKFGDGLKTIKKAFNSAGSNIRITDVNENPDPNKVFAKTQLLNLLNIKLQLLQGRYEQTAEVNIQKSALETSKAILNTFDQLKSEFDSKLDKQFLAEKAYPIFHRMLKVAHLAYEKNPSSETLQLALNIAEKNKDFVLLEALRNAQATQYGNVPQKVLDKEAQLRAEITYNEKEIFDATETESNFSDELFNLKQEYYSFLDSIKTNYPKYHELKYQNITLDLSTVREKVLDDNGTLISYTMTEANLYAIVLNGSGENFLKLPFSEENRKAVRDFYKLLSKPSIVDAQNEIAGLGNSLYDKILKKPLQGFERENLTIIPDGELHYLPFDLLRKNGSYLLKTTSIGYGNSVASLLELKKKKSSEKNRVLAFAPSFTGAVVANTDRQFGKLLYNDDEVSKIGAFYDTEMVLDEKATLANFKAKTCGFNVLHLATHASANDAYPDYSYLAFTETKDSAEGNILYIKDLYNTSLNVDMVTLSACQTGIGKLQKGQGMLSLSKGFYYAGAKSLVNTLWKINDKSTVKLMDYFYEGLSEGKSKTQALRDAKLKYLETTDDDLLQHPYYWAAFVVSGDVSPITETHYWWYIGAGVAFFVVLFFLSKRKGRIKEFRHIVFRKAY